ncbi:hypothetical protein [Clostridium estertheticum]|uniref:hypothetical protein n=1 Tax=Clostridium estertheticum TaxID=238834 RepID=UPI001C0E0361|nr:hypothetical protein [Clostridium estertheticum]MBU3174417.1 hypothetical protein [Clostridium estertheticum]
MKKSKISQLLLIISVVSLIFTGCNSASSNTKTEKLALTKENVQKAFAGKYDVGIKELDNERKSIDVSFNAKSSIPKNKAKESLKEIEDTLSKTFSVSDKQNIIIGINVNNNNLINSHYGKIQIGELPVIYVKEPNDLHSNIYSMSTKFNLINPAKNVIVTAKDKEDGDITSKIKLKNPEVLTKIADVQKLKYEVIDSDGNIGTDESVLINIMK